MASSKKSTFKEEDIVHASWRHEEEHEQGIRRGTCGWITSYDRNWRGESNTINTRESEKFKKVY